MSGNQSTLLGAGRGAPRPTGTLNGTAAIKNIPSATAKAIATGFTPALKVVLSGATTAGVLKTILSLSGSGVISALAVESIDATSRTHRIKITLDGVVIFDATSAAVASTSVICEVLGCVANHTASATSVVTFEPLAFGSSLLIEYADSLTEADGAYIAYRYYPT